jgi:DNA-binding SARP family transcriptional activator/tetratricopeptide (TPR) repeat protein
MGTAVSVPQVSTGHDDASRDASGGVAATGSVLRIGVLGEMTARRRDGSAGDGAGADTVIDLGGPRQRAVLGLLVLARGDVVPADRMIDALWGDETPPSATSALQAYISHLRRRLEPARGPRDRQSVIARQGPGYALRTEDLLVDSWDFERLLLQAGAAESAADAHRLLDRALALWRGPAFADHIGQPWADAESARLAGLRDVAREQRLEARLGAGESAVLVPEIEALVAEDPLREERWRLLVLALYRAHRQADALAALRRARSTLSDELGVDPGPALRALEAEVLAQSPTLDAPARTVAGEAAATPSAAPAAPTAPAAPVVPVAAAPSAPVVVEEMVDRDREVQVMAGALADALDGQGRLLLVHGPAGIGKSRLLQEVRRTAAEKGALVLTARGSQLERDFGFGAVRQLFEGVLADPARRATLLAGSASSAAAVFDDVPGTTHAHDPADRADGSFAVLHGLYWLTVNLAADRPVVLAVDDIQWCDTGSVRALAFLLRRLEGLPVLIATTLRTGETHEDESLLAELAQDDATVSVHPGPLGPEGTAQLVRLRLGDQAHERFVAACHRTTGGNPLLLRQLLRALQVEGVRPDASHADTVNAIGSRAVSSMVLMRLRRLPANCTAVARAVAVLGDGAELPVVAALAQLDEEQTAAAIAVLARAEVVRVDQPLGFVHPLVGEAVYQDVPPGERELAHERAARVLMGREATPEQVAAHLLLAPRRGNQDAVVLLRRAAGTAAERGAADAAKTYLQRALAEPPRAEDRPAVQVELGGLAAMTDGPAALASLRAAYASLIDPALRADVAIMLARTLVFAGEPGEATAFARAAAAGLPDELDDARQGLHALERIGGYMHGLPKDDWLLGRPEVRGTGVGARALAATLSWEELITTGDRAEAARLSRFANEHGQLQRHDTGLLWVVATFVLEMCDESSGDFWDRTLAEAYTRGSLFSALSVHLWRGHMLWHHGNLREALQSIHTSNDQSRAWGAPEVGVPYGQAFILGILLEQGDLAQARRIAEPVLDQPRFGDGARLFEENYARLRAAEGHHEEALARLDRTEQMQTTVTNPVWRPWRTYRAPILAAVGRVDEARELMVDEIAAARHWGAPSVLGRTLRVAGELGGPGSEEMLREALECLTSSVARFELACAELAVARVSRDPAERERLLRAALARSLECGSDGLYRQVAAELVADGSTGDDVPPDPAAVFTPTDTERRIVAAVAKGYTHREIAEALFLTPARVERTLAELRRGLAAASDAELAQMVASHRL